MKRRDLIKGLSLTFGYAVAAPAVLSVLESCSSKEQSWKPVFLSENEQHYISHLVDVILPETEIPGGLEINLPQFIDMMSHDMLKSDEKEMFKNGSSIFSERFGEKFNKDILESSREEIAGIFGSYFDLQGVEQAKVLKSQEKGIDNVDLSKKDDFQLYYFLIQVRKLSLFGYFTSEKIGKEVLNFDPIPGEYDPCIPVSEIGNAWTI